MSVSLGVDGAPPPDAAELLALCDDLRDESCFARLSPECRGRALAALRAADAFLVQVEADPVEGVRMLKLSREAIIELAGREARIFDGRASPHLWGAAVVVAIFVERMSGIAVWNVSFDRGVELDPCEDDEEDDDFNPMPASRPRMPTSDDLAIEFSRALADVSGLGVRDIAGLALLIHAEIDMASAPERWVSTATLAARREPHAVRMVIPAS